MSFLFDALGIDALSEGESTRINSITYVMRGGLLRQLKERSFNASHTEETYSHLWLTDDSYVSDQHIDYLRNSIEKEYPSISSRLPDLFEHTPDILDLGCGAGYSAYAIFGQRLNSARYLGVDLSNSVDRARDFYHSRGITAEFMQGDIIELPFPDNIADIVFCTGVLQHTDSVERALASISRVLRPNGITFFNCYRQVGPIREFSDRLIHEQVRDLSVENAMDELHSLTELGISLGAITEKITVPSDIPYLGIKKGTYGVQQFFYDYIFKAYYHENEKFDRLQYLNFDWYRPINQQHVATNNFLKMVHDQGLRVEESNETGTFISVVATCS